MNLLWCLKMSLWWVGGRMAVVPGSSERRLLLCPRTMEGASQHVLSWGAPSNDVSKSAHFWQLPSPLQTAFYAPEGGSGRDRCHIKVSYSYCNFSMYNLPRISMHFHIYHDLLTNLHGSGMRGNRNIQHDWRENNRNSARHQVCGNYWNVYLYEAGISLINLWMNKNVSQ